MRLLLLACYSIASKASSTSFSWFGGTDYNSPYSIPSLRGEVSFGVGGSKLMSLSEYPILSIYIFFLIFTKSLITHCSKHLCNIKPYFLELKINFWFLLALNHGQQVCNGATFVILQRWSLLLAVLYTTIAVRSSFWYSKNTQGPLLYMSKADLLFYLIKTTSPLSSRDTLTIPLLSITLLISSSII